MRTSSEWPSFDIAVIAAVRTFGSGSCSLAASAGACCARSAAERRETTLSADERTCVHAAEGAGCACERPRVQSRG